MNTHFGKVEVEYTKFSKKYDVWVEKNAMGGSGQIEARYFSLRLFWIGLCKYRQDLW